MKCFQGIAKIVCRFADKTAHDFHSAIIPNGIIVELQTAVQFAQVKKAGVFQIWILHTLIGNDAVFFFSIAKIGIRRCIPKPCAEFFWAVSRAILFVRVCYFGTFHKTSSKGFLLVLYQRFPDLQPQNSKKFVFGRKIYNSSTISLYDSGIETAPYFFEGLGNSGKYTPDGEEIWSKY